MGVDGRKWFEDLPENKVTPQPLSLDPSDWEITGNGEVTEDAVSIVGTDDKTIALYKPSGYDAIDINAEFLLDSNETAFGVIFAACGNDCYSYLRLDAESVLTGAVGPVIEKFRHAENPLSTGEWHSIRLRFTPQHDLFALFIDGKCHYEWLFYPRSEQKSGRVGFFAENGNVRIRDVYVTGARDN